MINVCTRSCSVIYVLLCSNRSKTSKMIRKRNLLLFSFSCVFFSNVLSVHTVNNTFFTYRTMVLLLRLQISRTTLVVSRRAAQTCPPRIRAWASSIIRPYYVPVGGSTIKATTRAPPRTWIVAEAVRPRFQSSKLIPQNWRIQTQAVIQTMELTAPIFIQKSSSDNSCDKISILAVLSLMK